MQETILSSEPNSHDVNFVQDQIVEEAKGSLEQNLNINIPRSKQRLRPLKNRSARMNGNSFTSSNSKLSKSYQSYAGLGETQSDIGSRMTMEFDFKNNQKQQESSSPFVGFTSPPSNAKLIMTSNQKQVDSVGKDGMISTSGLADSANMQQSSDSPTKHMISTGGGSNSNTPRAKDDNGSGQDINTSANFMNPINSAEAGAGKGMPFRTR